MFKNYFKIAVRNLLRHKSMSLINIIGMAIGIGCCLVIYSYIRYELSYDRYHPNAEQIFRVVMGNEKPTVAQISGPVGPNLQREYPEILENARVFKYWSTPLISHDEFVAFEEQFYFADQALLEILAFDCIKGNRNAALAAPFSVIITEETARRYFGDSDPIGQVLKFDATNTFTVTGVFRNLPHNTHFKFDFLASLNSLPVLLNWPDVLENWSMHAFNTYITLEQGHSGAALQVKLNGFFARISGKENQPLYLQPITDIHLHSQLYGELGENIDIRYVYILAALAVLILLIACINYMNLATAHATERAREIGLRKAIGAQKKQIATQFLGESILLAFLATIIALSIVDLILPVLNKALGKEMYLLGSATFFLLPSIFGIALFVGILSGSYPAFLLAALRPVKILKTSQPFQTTRKIWQNPLRSGLVAFQFVMSIALIASTIVIYQQLDFIKTSKMGFDKDQVVVLPVREQNVKQRYEALKSALIQQTDIISVSASTSVPGKSKPTPTVRWQGAAEGQTLNLTMNWVDENFLNTLGIELVAGTGFSKELAADADESVVLNEAAVRAMGWPSPEEALGKKIIRNEQSWLVKGVMKDYHFRSFHERIAPLGLFMRNGGFSYISVRLRPGDFAHALATIKNQWQLFAAEQPFSYFFFDEDFGRLYKAEEQWQRSIGFSSVLAIVVACLGLFGLAALTARQRTKEIGIRKVLGATVANVTALLSKDFVKLVLLANLLAWPVGWYAMHKWLQNFAYRIEISWWVFALAGGLALVIALLTVSTQAIRAALANPVDSLRYE